MLTIRSAGWEAPQEDLEKSSLRLGFVPLLDAAPLVVAKERGFFRRHGLDVELSRERSWANVRDNLEAGRLDAAQMLAPMTLAATLGAGARAVPMVTALSLGLNGNAITVSRSLLGRMQEIDPPAMRRSPVPARALKAVLDEDRRRGRPPLAFAVVYPFSAHNYELRYWLATGGVDPDRDLEIRTVPPSAMVEALADGTIDGYCVGEPWGAYAAHGACGHAIVRTYDVWNNAPEKVLGVTRAWAERHPCTHRALVRALIEAARWIDRPENRLETLHVIAGESFVDAPVEVLERALARAPSADGDATVAAGTFYRGAATFPWRSHAVWFLTQMLRWGQIDAPVDFAAVSAAVYRCEIYREAAEPLGVPVPLVDSKDEGVHDAPWLLGEATSPIAMGPDAFLDRRTFDPNEPLRYLAAFAATRAIAPLRTPR
ncbi:MAG: ABC transporter substrate-binding protein [Deltaproteobacteria bacterium]|nr:ABC transporter substrate-binding protein [Deltaproteobacteria bacterium]